MNKIIYVFFILWDRSYSSFVMNNSPEFPIDKISLFPPGQFDATTIRS